MITAAQFENQVIQLVKECFGSLEAFAEAYNRQLDSEDEKMSTFSVIVTEYYQPSTGGRPYQSERVLATMLPEAEAKIQAAEYNTKRTEGQYYSVRME